MQVIVMPVACAETSWKSWKVPARDVKGPNGMHASSMERVGSWSGGPFNEERMLTTMIVALRNMIIMIVQQGAQVGP